MSKIFFAIVFILFLHAILPKRSAGANYDPARAKDAGGSIQMELLLKYCHRYYWSVKGGSMAN